MKNIILSLIILSLTACAGVEPTREPDNTIGWSVDNIYKEGHLNLKNREYDKAIGYFSRLEAKYPNGQYAAHAQLEKAYAYYKQQNTAMCKETLDNYIEKRPNSENLDYAFYLKGLAVFNDNSFIDKLTKQEVSERDPRPLRESFDSFKELANRFPNSKYTKDATQRMIYLANTLAEHELHVAKYYAKLNAHVATVNRCKYVIEMYPQSTGVESALVLMTNSYGELGLEDLKADTLEVIKLNFPSNPLVAALAS